MHDYNEAIKVATDVIDIHPTCYQAFHARTKAHHVAEHFDHALHDLNEAVRVAHQNRELRYSSHSRKRNRIRHGLIINESISDYNEHSI